MAPEPEPVEQWQGTGRRLFVVICIVEIALAALLYVVTR